MEAQIIESEDQPNFSKKIDFHFSPTVKSQIETRIEEIKKEALRSQKEKETKRNSLKIFDWLKKTPEFQIGIITNWAGHHLPSGAIRLSITRAKISKNLIAKVSGVIGSASYTIGQTWNLRNSPDALEEKIKIALQKKVSHNNNASLALSEMRLV